MRTTWAIAAIAAWTLPAAAVDPPPLMIPEQTITTDAAMLVVGTALAICRQDLQRVSVTVVDHTGRIKAQVRDDGAAPHTLEHSFRKAYTALSYKMPSADYGKRAKDAGGAIGVSGTPSSAGGGEHDAKCAQQGIVKAFGD